ncbi:MAG: DUF6457 domain-containing protein [Actinomycetota bacterium]
MDANEETWLRGVADRLGVSGEATLDDETKRVLLRMTKVTADATGIRYLAPLTAFVVGRAAGHAESAGERFDLRAAADAVSALAEGWELPKG